MSTIREKLRGFSGFFNPLLRLVNLPNLPKPIDWTLSALVSMGLTITVGPDVASYFKQPFDIADSIILSRSENNTTFKLTKQRTREGGRIDGFTCLAKGAMSPAFFVTFRPQEEVFPVLDNSRFIQGAPEFYIVMNIYYENREASVVEWWDGNSYTRLHVATIDRKMVNCPEARNAIAS